MRAATATWGKSPRRRLSRTSAQRLPGSLNITTLLNGWYYARIEVNPLGALYETTTANNTESRLLYLGGRQGHRTVLVTPWHGVDYRTAVSKAC